MIFKTMNIGSNRLLNSSNIHRIFNSSIKIQHSSLLKQITYLVTFQELIWYNQSHVSTHNIKFSHLGTDWLRNSGSKTLPIQLYKTRKFDVLSRLPLPSAPGNAHMVNWKMSMHFFFIFFFFTLLFHKAFTPVSGRIAYS